MPETEEMWVQSLGRQDPLEEGMATHSSLLASEIPWREEPGGPQSMGSQSQTRPERLCTAGLHKKLCEPWKPAWGCLSRECWGLKAQRAIWALDEPASLASLMHPPEVGARAEEAQSVQGLALRQQPQHHPAA